jgi:transcriptional repressor NrdR
MRCPWCSADDDKVVDSRPSEAGDAIRRRRECLSCGRRFTTYERVEDVGVVVRKRDGTKEPFDRDKLEAGIRKALSSRPVTNLAIDQMLGRIETRLRKKGPEVTSQQIGLEVLSALRKTDQVAYLRYASVYKDFEGVEDFERELELLLRKPEPGRRRPS